MHFAALAAFALFGVAIAHDQQRSALSLEDRLAKFVNSHPDTRRVDSRYTTEYVARARRARRALSHVRRDATTISGHIEVFGQDGSSLGLLSGKLNPVDEYQFRLGQSGHTTDTPLLVTFPASQSHDLALSVVEPATVANTGFFGVGGFQADWSITSGYGYLTQTAQLPPGAAKAATCSTYGGGGCSYVETAIWTFSNTTKVRRVDEVR